MMTKLAHIRENRKNNKGFSLVELIIVIAIMVALVAIMGPQYIKYVQSSRDAVIQDAAENVLSVAKTEFASGNIDFGTTENVKNTMATIEVGAVGGNGNVIIVCKGLEAGGSAASGYSFINACGLSTKLVDSDSVYTITIKNANGDTNFSMAQTSTAKSVTLLKETGSVDITCA